MRQGIFSELEPSIGTKCPLFVPVGGSNWDRWAEGSLVPAGATCWKKNKGLLVSVDGSNRDKRPLHTLSSQLVIGLGTKSFTSPGPNAGRDKHYYAGRDEICSSVSWFRCMYIYSKIY